MNILLKILFFISTFFILLKADTVFSKDYYKMHISKQKEYFFAFFNKRIEIENKKILEERAFIKSLNNNKNLDINSKEYKRLEELQIKYKVRDIYNYSRFLERVNIIPPSLALAQAATESGWGKSRFFKKANNIFGHWTYNAKHGIVPKRRAAGSKHLIRVFNNLQDSLSAYMLNLNRHTAYKSFREKRYQARIKNKNPMGMELSQTMLKYSGIGKKYLAILKSVIKKNNLTNYDKRFYQETQK